MIEKYMNIGILLINLL